MVHKGTSSSYRSPVGQLHRALILLGLAHCLPSACVSSLSSVFMVLLCYIYALQFILLTSFSLPFSELSLVGLAFDLVD